MKKFLILVILFFLISLKSLFAQKNCGSELDVQELQKTDPKRYERLMQFNKLVEQYSITNSNERIIDTNGTIIIPVVFHLLHDGQPQPFLNPTDARVQSQITILNEDFRRLNADRVKYTSFFSKRGC